MYLQNTFLSPYGVIFILIWELCYSTDITDEFPSPYGVSFILIYNTRMVNHIRCYSSVSVSLWSIIHSYLIFVTSYIKFCSFIVSVSLQSYIHSYSPDMLDRYLAGDWFPSPYGVIFILTLEHQKDDGLF